MEIKGVTESVVEYIRDKIVIGELVPGQKIEENHWASKMGVSRPPLREAFRILENENLVTNIPRKGTFVTEMSKDDRKKVWQAREMIECYTIDLLEEKNSRELPEVTEDLDLAANFQPPPTDDFERYLKYYCVLSNFHFKLIEATGNSWLMRFKRAIYSVQARYRFIFIVKPGAAERCIQEHRKILTNINNGNYEKAKQYMTDHVWNAIC